MTPELSLQRSLRAGVLCEDDEARCVLVDAMDGERAPFAVRPQGLFEVVVHRRGAALPLERDGEQAGGLVDDDERFVLINDIEIDRGQRSGSSSTAWPIHPQANDVTGSHWLRRVSGADLGPVEKDLAAFEGCQRTAARSEAVRRRQEFVQPRVRLVAIDVPTRIRHDFSFRMTMGVPAICVA
jgi:hypothetical protein